MMIDLCFFIFHSAFFISSHLGTPLAILICHQGRCDNKVKVLVCDDDPATCEIISAVLSDAGYEAKEVYDGAGALKELKRRRYEVMILDYMLGETNGLDILQKACQLDHEVRIIMISGYQSLADPSRLGQADDLAKRAKELGASDFLSKPFLMQELLKAVGKSRKK